MVDIQDIYESRATLLPESSIAPSPTSTDQTVEASSRMCTDSPDSSPTSSDRQRPPLAPWVMRANRAQRADILPTMKQYAKDNDLGFSDPYHGLHIRVNDSATLSGIRTALTTHLGEEATQLLYDLQLVKVVTWPSGSLPFAVPPGCTVRKGTEEGEYQVYPTKGPAWDLDSIQHKCSYTVQPGVGVRVTQYDTLVSETGDERSGLNICAVREYHARPHPDSTHQTPDQRAQLTRHLQPILDATRFRAGLHDLQGIMQTGDTALALQTVQLDFGSLLEKVLPALWSQGWVCVEGELTRDDSGRMASWGDTRTAEAASSAPSTSHGHSPDSRSAFLGAGPTRFPDSRGSDSAPGPSA